MRASVVWAKCLDSGSATLYSQLVETTPIGGGTNRICQGSGRSGKSYTFFSIRTPVPSNRSSFLVLVTGPRRSLQIDPKFPTS
jgi:hypothetical protein